MLVERSRGWAVADVNYGGSSGYGRAFRDRLKGTWGVVDVEDVSAAALHLVAAGRADAKRLCIDGGSAGGYTTLACLAFTNVFKAGASLYGCVRELMSAWWSFHSQRHCAGGLMCRVRSVAESATCVCWRGTRTSSSRATWNHSSVDGPRTRRSTKRDRPSTPWIN
jgi:hypothetical protein